MLTPAEDLAPVDRLRRLPRALRALLYQRLRRAGAGALATRQYDWETFWARPDQLVTAAQLEGVSLLVFTGERGAGKTEAALRFFSGEILAGRARKPRIFARTEADVAMLAKRIRAMLPPHHQPEWLSSSREGPAGILRFQNGIEVVCFAAVSPEGCVSHEGDLDLYDDVAKWGPHAERAWAHARFSCRLVRRGGAGALGICATTRRGTSLLKRLLAGDMGGVLLRRPPAVNANAGNLTPGHHDQMAAELGGSRLHDEDMEDRDLAESSPFAGLSFDAPPIRLASVRREELLEVAVVVDPALTAGPQSDEWGIVVMGRRASGALVLLEDLSGVLDDGAAGERIVVACERWRADSLVAEINRGKARVLSVVNAAWQKRRGDALEAGSPVPRGLPAFVPITTRQEKPARAGPVVTLYRCGQLQHLPGLGALEAQALAWDPSAPPRPRQDDRIDALMLGAHHLGRLGEASPMPAATAGTAEANERMRRDDAAPADLLW